MNKNFFSMFSLKKISDFFGGRKFIAVILAVFLAVKRIPIETNLMIILLGYMASNIIEGFAPNLNKSIPDVVKIVKKELGVPDVPKE